MVIAKHTIVSIVSIVSMVLVDLGLLSTQLAFWIVWQGSRHFGLLLLLSRILGLSGKTVCIYIRFYRKWICVSLIAKSDSLIFGARHVLFVLVVEPSCAEQVSCLFP